MDGVVVEVPDLAVIGSEARQRVSVYVLHYLLTTFQKYSAHVDTLKLFNTASM